MTDETYVSVDIEADGPIPGRNSMLALGVAAFRLDGKDPRTPLSTFEVNLEQLAEATPDPTTMSEFWAKQPAAWAACRENPRSPADAMLAFRYWLGSLPGKIVFVGYPVTYDFMFVYWYWCAFGPKEKSPFGFQGLDIKTLAMMSLRLPFRRTSKREMPKCWFEGAPPHTHRAIDDAIGQGVLFVNIMREWLRS